MVARSSVVLATALSSVAMTSGAVWLLQDDGAMMAASALTMGGGGVQAYVALLTWFVFALEPCGLKSLSRRLQATILAWATCEIVRADKPLKRSVVSLIVFFFLGYCRPRDRYEIVAIVPYAFAAAWLSTQAAMIVVLAVAWFTKSELVPRLSAVTTLGVSWALAVVFWAVMLLVVYYHAQDWHLDPSTVLMTLVWWGVARDPVIDRPTIVHYALTVWGSLSTLGALNDHNT